MFKPSELKLGYLEFKALIEKRKAEVADPATQEWLAAWNRYDLAVSPMDDEERRFVRYGHYLGWFDSKEES